MASDAVSLLAAGGSFQTEPLPVRKVP